MQTTIKTAVALAAASMACASTAWAARPGTPTLSEVLEASGVTVTGYVDTSYTYLSGTGLFTTTSGTVVDCSAVTCFPNRVFDRERNSFNLHQVNLTLSGLPSKGFGALVDIAVGTDAEYIGAATTGSVADEIDATQAFVQYADGPLSVRAGRFATIAGFEVIKSPENLNFSRGILFGYAMPGTHTGVRATFEATKNLKFTAGVNNGWDVLKESASEPNKTLEFGASVTPIPDLSVSAAIYRGEEPGTTVAGMRTLIDVVASYAFTKALTLALNIDMAEQEDAVAAGTDAEWQGAGVFANFVLNEKWRFAARLENFDDKDGYRTNVDLGAGGQKWKEATLTAAFLPSKNVELRAEARADRSDKEVFMQPDGGTPGKSQSSFALEAIYKL